MKQLPFLCSRALSAAFGLQLFACSAPEKAEPGAGNSEAPPGGAFIEEENQGTKGGGSEGFLGDEESGGSPGGTAQNTGTELLCDGIDENNNGIIDDVDVGNDGLCDCLNIAFLGRLDSDAGNATGAFEAWLEARSEIPVQHIGATEKLTEATFASTQVLVIGNMTERVGTPYSATEIAALEAFIKQRGGGVISLAGYTADESAMDPTVELMAFTGLSYDYKGRGAGILGEGAPPVRVTGIQMPSHPTMEGVQVVGVYYGYPVTGDGDVLIADGGFTLAMAKQLEAGRVFAFADEWVTQDKLWVADAAPQALTPCQQGCAQCEMQCGQCDVQCADCESQPCQGGEDQDPETCPRGCDGACSSCQEQCTRCESECATCSAEEMAEPDLDMARFWLNIMRWLTPENECKVRIPIDVRAK